MSHASSRSLARSSRRTLGVAGVAVALAASTACGGGTSVDAADLGPIPDVVTAPCDPRPPVEPRRTVKVQVLLGRGVEAEGARAKLAVAKAVWGRVGVALDVDPQATRVDDAHAFGAGATPAEVVAPARALVTTWATPAKDRIVVAMLPSVATTDSPLLSAFDATEGFALSASGEGPLREALALEAAHDPLVVVAVPGGQLPPSAVDTALAHGIGHALGLDHASATSDVMTPGIKRCLPGLDDDARDELAPPPEE